MTGIDLYSFATPNGQKIGIALEELDLTYRAHVVDITKGDQHHPDFLKVNPNGKIPAIVDHDAEGGQRAVFESGAILMHLAEKTGRLLPPAPGARSEAVQWLFFQVGGVGPMFGQFGHFHAHAKEPHPYALERYATETRRLLGVLETRLRDNAFLAGAEYSIADIATAPWVAALSGFYKAEEILKLREFTAVERWRKDIFARPAVRRGIAVCRPTVRAT